MKAVLLTVVLIAVVISVYTDLRWRKIKNYVTIPLFLFGIAYWSIEGGALKAIESALVGGLIGFLILRGAERGAGDIKLAVGLATCLGYPSAFLFLAWTYISSVVSALHIRFKVHGYRLVPAIFAIKQECILEIMGVPNSNTLVHGERIRRPAAPTMAAALILTLVTGGLLPWQI
jgi:Flp pilus assembly protein protease CpaA